MATHSSVLAWRIPGMGKPGGLPSMGSHRVGHDWSKLAAAEAAKGSNKKKRNIWQKQKVNLYKTIITVKLKLAWLWNWYMYLITYDRKIPVLPWGLAMKPTKVLQIKLETVLQWTVFWFYTTKYPYTHSVTCLSEDFYVLWRQREDTFCLNSKGLT